MSAVRTLRDRVMYGEGSARQASAYQGQKERSRELELNNAFHEVVQNVRRALPRPTALTGDSLCE